MAQRDMVIRAFETGDEGAFRRLNEEWIRRYFALEARDVETLGDPQGMILKQGGHIFMAVCGGETVGCCALLKIAPDEYKVAKMAVTPASQGLGVGRRLMERVMEAAWATGAKRLCLLTNHVLTAAIALYESVGFRHVALDATRVEYARADVYMEMFRPS